MVIFVKILVDADACPVRHIVEQVAKEFQLLVLMFIDTSHELTSDYSKIIQVSKAPDAVDIALINQMNIGDIVVTSDYGVATLVLGKKGYAIHPNGKVYTNENIDLLMFERHLSRKQRQSGIKTCSVKRRTKEDNKHFYEAFYQLCKNVLEQNKLL